MRCRTLLFPTCLLLCAVFLLMSTGCRKKVAIPSAPNTHPVISTKGYTVDIPNGWIEQKAISGMIDKLFSRPATDNANEFTENVNIVIEPLPGPVTTDEYYNASLRMLNQVMPAFTEVSATTVTGNATGKRLVYTWVMNSGIHIKGMAYFFVKGTNGYVLTCTATDSTFANYETQFDQIGRSFRWND